MYCIYINGSPMQCTDGHVYVYKHEKDAVDYAKWHYGSERVEKKKGIVIGKMPSGVAKYYLRTALFT